MFMKRGKVTKEPTCYVSGTKIFTCTNCNNTKEEKNR